MRLDRDFPGEKVCIYSYGFSQHCDNGFVYVEVDRRRNASSMAETGEVKILGVQRA